jgi:hypothetical protein
MATPVTPLPSSDLSGVVDADTEKLGRMSPVGAGALAGALIVLAAVAGILILYCRRRRKASTNKKLNRGTSKWIAVPETSVLVNPVASGVFSSGIRSQEVW